MTRPCLPVPAFLVTFLPLTYFPYPSPPIWACFLFLCTTSCGAKGQVEKEQGLGLITYPQPVGQGDHLGCDGFGVLLPDGIQDDVGQKAVTFLCIKHLFPG